MTNDKTITSQNIVGPNAIKDSSLENQQEIKPSDAQPINEQESSVNNVPIDSKDSKEAERKELIQQTPTNGTNEQAETISSIESSVTQNPIDQFSSGVDSKQSIVRSMTTEDLFATRLEIDNITNKTQSTLNTIGETIGKIFTSNTQSDEASNTGSVEKSKKEGLGDKFFKHIKATTFARIIIGVKKNTIAALAVACTLFAACWFIGGTVLGAAGIGAVVGTIFLVGAVVAFIKTEQLKDSLNIAKMLANEANTKCAQQAEKIKELSEGIAELKKNLEEAQGTIAKLKTNNDKLNSQIKDADEKTIELQKRHDELSEKLKKFQKEHEEQCSELKSQIESEQATCNDLSENIEKQKKELKTIEDELNNQLQIKENLERAQKLQEAQIKQKETQINELTKQVELQKEEKTQLEIKIKSQQLEIDQKDNQLRLTTEQLQAAHKQLELETQHNANLKTQVEACYGCFDKLINGQKDSIKQLQKQFEDQQNTTRQIVEHIQGIKGGEEKLTEISEYAKGKLGKAQKLLSEIADLSVEITDKEKMKEMLNNGTLQKRLAKINKNTAEVQKILGDLSVKLVNDIAEVQKKIATEREAAKEKISELSSQIDAANKTITKQENEINEQKSKIDEQKKEFKKKQEELEIQKQEIQKQSQLRQKELQKEIDNHKAQLKQQQDALDAKNEEINQKRQELSDVKNQNIEEQKRLENEIKNLERDLSDAQTEIKQSNQNLSYAAQCVRNLQQDAEIAINNLIGQINAQKIEIDKLEQKSTTEIKKMQEDLQRAQAINKELHSNLSDAQTTIKQQNENIAKLTKINEQMDSQLTSAEECNKQLEEQNEASQTIINKLQTALGEMEQIINQSKIQGNSSWWTTLKKGIIATATTAAVGGLVFATGGMAGAAVAAAGIAGAAGAAKINNM